MENVLDDDDKQLDAQIRELFDLLPLVPEGAKPNAALTLAACRRLMRGVMRDADVFPLIRDLEKQGIFERVPGHKPIAWRTAKKKK
jgi:hypothetical protein